MIRLRTVFYWQGLDSAGYKKRGMEISEHVDAARSLLKSRGIIVMEFTKRRRLVFNYRTPSSQDIVLFSQQLGDLLEANFPLLNALETLSEQHSLRSPMRDVLLGLKSFVEDGLQFSEALKHYSHCFNPFYVQLVRVGEKCGRIAQQLLQLGAYYDKRRRLRSSVHKALYYPVGLLMFACLVLTIFILGVIPRFETLFAAAGVPLPRLTQVLIHLSHLTKNYGTIVFTGTGMLIMTYHLLSQYSKRFSLRHKIFLVPWVGNIAKTALFARFSRTLGALLENNINILEALTYTQEVLNYRIYEEAVHQAKIDVSNGIELYEALERTKCFPSFFLQVIRTGQKTGQLSRNLHQMSVFLEKKVSESTETMIRLLEPITLLLVSGIIGLVMLALYWPIFELGQVVSVSI